MVIWQFDSISSFLVRSSSLRLKFNKILYSLSTPIRILSFVSKIKFPLPELSSIRTEFLSYGLEFHRYPSKLHQFSSNPAILLVNEVISVGFFSYTWNLVVSLFQVLYRFSSEIRDFQCVIFFIFRLITKFSGF